MISIGIMVEVNNILLNSGKDRMNNVKEYRNNELKQFVMVHIMALLYLGDVFNVGDIVCDDLHLSIITTIINSALFSSIIYILVIVWDAVVPSQAKNYAIYWWSPLPGHKVFSEWKRKQQDGRVSQNDFMDHYAYIYGELTSNVKTDEYQNSEWYKIYNKYRKDDMVVASHKDFLMFRDMAVASIVILVLYVIFGLIVGTVPLTIKGIIFLLIMYTMVNIAARNKGKKFVNNVLLCDIDSAYKTVNKQ